VTISTSIASGKMVEEAGASNFFAVFPNNTIVTPSLNDGTILPGVTRSSILELACSELGYVVQERRLSIYELKYASEAFCCGTGASITPVGCVNYLDNSISNNERFEVVFGDKPGPTTERLYTILRSIQNGSYNDGDDYLHEKYSHWCLIVEP
jgi:branched-chain amino acid aminotransferase